MNKLEEQYDVVLEIGAQPNVVGVTDIVKVEKDGEFFLAQHKNGQWEIAALPEWWKISCYNPETGDERDLRNPYGVLLFFGKGAAEGFAQYFEESTGLKCWPTPL